MTSSWKTKKKKKKNDFKCLKYITGGRENIFQ